MNVGGVFASRSSVAQERDAPQLRAASGGPLRFAARLADGVHVRGPVERVSAAQQQVHEVGRDVPPGDVQPLREVREGEAVHDGHDVGHAVAGVDHEACGGAVVVVAVV